MDNIRNIAKDAIKGKGKKDIISNIVNNKDTTIIHEGNFSINKKI